MNEESFELELRNTFLTETQEMLEDTESIFMQIEMNPNDLSKMDKILRIAHTIKGSGAVVGFNELSNFTHKFETLLVALRDKIIEINAEIIDLLLASNDCLKHCVAILQKDHKGPVHILKKTEAQLEVVLKKKLIEASNGVPVSENMNENKEHAIDQKSDNKLNTQQKNLNKGTILVCDDEEDVLVSLNQILSFENHVVIACSSVASALEALKTEPIDVILTDLHMPEMNGLDLAKEIRKINNYIPIIFVSGNTNRELLKQFITLGVNDFIDKPFSVDDIILAVDRAIQTKLLWNELLVISKACFKTYVYANKIDKFINTTDNEYKQDHLILNNCLIEIQKSAKRLLKIEKVNQDSILKNFDETKK